MNSKVISARQAAELIPDHCTIAAATQGFNGWPQEVALAIRERFEETGHPGGLTLMHSCTCGDHGDNLNGTNALALEGLVERLICAHTGSGRKMSQMAAEGKVQCYLLPQGVFPQLYRSMAGGKPGVITKVGLHTFVDPRVEGGRANDATTEDLVKVIELDGEQWLHYPNIPVQVALLRGTCCDERGNMTMDEETGFLEALSLACAVKNAGGIVIAQVKYLAEAGSLHPKRVKVPASLIDHIVLSSGNEYHMQTQQTVYNPAFAGDVKMPLGDLPRLPLNARKVIARRGAMELRRGNMVNLGVGMPDGIASVVAEEGFSSEIVLTTETGSYGGTPATGLDFGAIYNAEAIIDHGDMFDWYDGGGLDVTFLGLGQVDREGNVNVSKLGKLINGPGGFINISQNTHKVVFCGTFSNGAELAVGGGQLKILKEGKSKFVEKVLQITFSGKFAREAGQDITLITERCVFKLVDQQLVLTEIAPGVDLDRDILALMPFAPVVAEDLGAMPPALFNETWGGLGETFV